MPRSIQVRAFAKINLGLRILGRRPDGFHELRTVFQTISLADRLTISLSAGRGVKLLVTGDDGGAGPAANLAARAAASAAEAFNIRGRIQVQLEKRVPVGAGLGGGSSDAAAVLRALAGWVRPQPELADLLPLAAALGCDVPALLVGGTVLGLDRGDDVHPLPDLPRWHGVLTLPAAGPASAVSTAAAFAAWDRRRAPRPVHAPRRLLANDFEPGLAAAAPAVTRLRRNLLQQGARWASLTGSGAGIYGLFPQSDQAARALAHLRSAGPAWPFRFITRAEHHRGLGGTAGGG